MGLWNTFLMDKNGNFTLWWYETRYAISWPNVIKDKGGIRNQFHHVIDIMPTILEATGIPLPEVIDGIKQKPMDGTSMLYTFDEMNARAPSTHKTSTLK